MDTSAYAMLHVYPLFCWTAAPTEQCSTETPLVLITNTGLIGDGQGQLSRLVSKDQLLCSWILAPGGQAGGFQEVTLIFTQFLLTSEDAD